MFYGSLNRLALAFLYIEYSLCGFIVEQRSLSGLPSLACRLFVEPADPDVA